MDDRMLSALVLVGLSGVFGSYGIFPLVAAYQAGDLADWARLAIMGGVSVLLSAFLVDVAVVAISSSGAASPANQAINFITDKMGARCNQVDGQKVSLAGEFQA